MSDRMREAERRLVAGGEYRWEWSHGGGRLFDAKDGRLLGWKSLAWLYRFTGA